MVSLSAKAVCIIDCHNKLVYMNDFYQNLFNEEKIGYKTKLGDAVINEINKVSYHTIQKTDFKVIKEDFIINDQASYIYTLERVNINSVSPVLESALYDELVEINLTRDTYNILFYRKDKYIIPALSGSFSKRIREIAQKIIHPHDQNDFLQLFNKMKNNHGDFKPVMGRFRRLLNNGEYSWINGILIAISKGQFSDTVYMCLFQDGGLTPINVESTNYKEYDQTTGLLNEHSFLKAARFLLEEGGNDNYCLIAIDIEHFKLFNDWYGRQMGNKILGQIGLELQKIQNEFKTVAGYFGGDDFVVIMPNERPLIDKLLTDLIAHIKVVTVNPGFFPKFGIYIVIDGEYVAAMYDRALIALSSIKENYTKQIAYYDSNIRQDFEYSQSILMDTQQALYNHEFMVYFQPKCNMLNGKIVGVEALVRWNHPTKGIISPGDFVFILEKNGFIVNLDLFVWQETCRLLSNWLDQGNQGVPVSVNVSRTDIYAIDVVKTFKELVAEYKLPVNLIEIEITESSYASDYEIISKVVDDFRLAGFTVLMDDFGSGYSSLNMLKDVNVDILKIDMKFLELREDSIGRGIGILEAIVKMAKLMGLRVIAEGVETKQQIDLLNELGCIYGQGYYFYPPLSVQEFEAIISNSDLVDYRGIMLKQVDQVRLQDIFINDISSEAMLNNILGGIAFYQVSEDKISIIKVNDIFYHITKINPADFENIRDRIIEFVHPDDQNEFISLFDQAYQNPISGSEATIRYYSLKGKVSWISLRVFFLRKQDKNLIFYGAMNDVTKNNLQEQELKASKQTINQLLGFPEDTAVEDYLNYQDSQTAVSMFSKVVPAGILGCYRTKELPIYFINREMLSLLNLTTMEEFNLFCKGQIINIIHPEDHQTVYAAIGLEEDEGFEYTVRYRIMKKDQTWLWVQEKGRIVKAKDGLLAYICAIVDINETMSSKIELEKINQQLIKQKQQLSFLNECTLGGYFHCKNNSQLEFDYLSESFLNIVGFSQVEIITSYNNQLVQLIHPDDRHKITDKLTGKSTSINLMYRINSSTGYMWVTNQLELVAHQGNLIWRGIVINITERVELKNHLEAVVNNSPGDIFMMTPNHIEFFSSNLSTSLGYCKEEYCQLTKRSYDLIDKRDIDYVNEAFEAAYREKRPLDVIYRVQHKNGSIAYIQMIASYYEDKAGRPYFYGDFINITEVVNARKNNQLVIDNTMTVVFLIRLRDAPPNFENPEINMISIGILEKYGYTKQSCIEAMKKGGNCGLINKNDYAAIKDDYIKAVDNKEDYNAIYRFELEQTTLWMDSKTKYLNTENGYRTYLCVLNDVTSMKQKEEEIWLSSQILDRVIKMANLNIWQYDYQTKQLILMNLERDSFIYQILDLPRNEDIIIDNYLNKINNIEVMNEQTKEKIREQLIAQTVQNKFSYELPLTLNSKIIWIKVVGETIYDYGDRPLKLVGYFKDVTLEKSSFQKYLENAKTLEALQEKSFYELSINLSQNRIINTNIQEDDLSFINSSYSSYINSITEKIIQKEYQDKVKEVLGLEAILTRYQQGTTTNSVVYKRYVDGEYYWMEATYHILDLQENKDIFCYLYVIDIDKQKRQELALKNKAEHDGLTGLYNRSKAINEINQILLSNEMTCGALLMLDMNDFKEINDNYGHAIGDKIITKTAKRLKEMFRNDDILCRLGGDEFMILCRNIDEISIRMKLEDVTRQMKIPYLIEEYQIMAPLSIGFVMIPLYGTTFNNLYKKADIALYKAKQDGLASYRMYHDDMNKKAL